ncbi:DNA cytosine methyltransferase [Salinisphaera sp.]|uniref:DNA cytosine methyltransferase n=1 Tax=Salinisphaera sp. TaxID=1914330 RepID=UPI000C61A0FC|nr:DNA cytosine methyltransferase [Salinisphaera sp.]MAS11205.1 DNA (cytosine-5-)-methyltransferase [Salinisphaera sp.]|tara:strand:+ start:2683 stop:4308 length:1626 start_codon:yes stop_codon:yes gene_type:complete
MRSPIPVVDVFAGPGGLSEGFASLPDDFHILVSAEKEAFAHRTLRLRSFRRLVAREGSSLDSYYRYLNKGNCDPWDDTNRNLWGRACEEALCLELGKQDDDALLHSKLEAAKLEGSDWVLVGGPPCQAYSLVGRARNKGKADYNPDKDERHRLYQEYLKIIQKFRPSVFVMENVKGILSSTYKGERIFKSILHDLSDPDRAVGGDKAGAGYRITSLVHDGVGFTRGCDPDHFDGRAFNVRSEDHGIPQARHRVILLGIREDLPTPDRILEPLQGEMASVADAISDLPKLRSRISRQADSYSEWKAIVLSAASSLSEAAKARRMTEMAAGLQAVGNSLRSQPPLDHGALRVPDSFDLSARTETRAPHLADWVLDDRLDVVLNHEARSHMKSDLARYLYVSVFGTVWRESPTSHGDFDLPGLKPKHENWSKGHFADRFRVQLEHLPSKTVTSHISKDGHYYIHPDPTQCRALTVREAARLQTFPDNYFFEGNRTEQYIQVGNAVPPLLAKQIAEVVRNLLEKHRHTPASRREERSPIFNLTVV